MVPLAADADLHGNVVRGFRRRRPDLDLVRVQDVFPPGTPDPDVLEWAAAEGRVLVTQDVNTMVGHAWARVRAGQPMPGVLVCGPRLTIGQAIDELEMAADGGEPEDFRDQVQFLPL